MRTMVQFARHKHTKRQHNRKSERKAKRRERETEKKIINLKLIRHASQQQINSHLSPTEYRFQIIPLNKDIIYCFDRLKFLFDEYVFCFAEHSSPYQQSS